MSRGPDAATILQRALERAARASGCTVTVGETQMTRWASATFSGARHRLALAARDDAALAAWLEGLGDADVPMRGHLAADVVVASVSRRDGSAAVVLEVLTLEV